MSAVSVLGDDDNDFSSNDYLISMKNDYLSLFLAAIYWLWKRLRIDSFLLGALELTIGFVHNI